MKRFILCMYALCTAAQLFCADVPAWFKKPEKAYPEAQYIRALGEGSSAQAAKEAALSEIALYFDTKVDVVKHSVEELGEYVKNGESQFFSTESYSRVAKVTSNAEFFCTSFTEPYYNKKTKKYSVLAYIDRTEAARVYSARIDALMQALDAYKSYAQQEAEPFRAAQALGAAQGIASVAEQYIKAESTIVPNDIPLFRPQRQRIADIATARAGLQKALTFSITLNQKEKRYDPVFSTVAAVLERKGYAYSVSGARYAIVIDISCIEEHYDAGEFVHPSVDILVLNADGQGVYTYSKALPRTGSRTMEQAYIRAVSKITQDVEENFLKGE